MIAASLASTAVPSYQFQAVLAHLRRAMRNPWAILQ